MAVTIALLAPLGLALGTAMPIGLGRLSAMYPDGVPWAWGINGVFSVVASVLAIMVALNWGFTVMHAGRPGLLPGRAGARGAGALAASGEPTPPADAVGARPRGRAA